MGFQTIGEIDELVRNSTEVLYMYEEQRFSRYYLDTVKATRISIGLHYPEIGRVHSSRYFVSEFDRYNGIARETFIPTHPINTD